MQNRQQLITALVTFSEPIDPIIRELLTYSWDSDETLITLTPHIIIDILKRFENNELSAEDVNKWANAVELREDIAIEADSEDMVKQAIYLLANPEINLPIDHQLATRLMVNLQLNRMP